MSTQSPSSDDPVPLWNVSESGLSEYDLVLFAIPVTFLAGGAASLSEAVPFRVALVMASLLSAAVVVEALFINPPE